VQLVEGENINSRLWALIKRATERGEDLHPTLHSPAERRSPSQQRDTLQSSSWSHDGDTARDRSFRKTVVVGDLPFYFVAEVNRCI